MGRQRPRTARPGLLGEPFQRRAQVVEMTMCALHAQRHVARGVEQPGGRRRVARRRARSRAVGSHRAAIVRAAADRNLGRMSPFWIWTQVALVVFVLIGIVIAIVKLA